MFAELRRMNARQVAFQILNILSIATSALMIWKGLAVLTNTESPIVVVLSGSMEPAFHRGDLLFLGLPKNDPVHVNDICVFKLPGRDIPIVHRVIKLHDDVKTQKQYLLTKGDNNPSDDRALYNRRQMWIHKEHIVGKVKGFVPYVGMVTILMNDYPWLKFVVLGILGLFVLIHRE
ncbi:Signal peptidase complex catalytic subunit S11C [Apophysomyces sp. BC1034]|nr:Signal peptidase complex catalytic subunit S11C [Apophysomyces sp. BC1015]KAG0177134.1 Signal peptidase complex catalytic subunit S11C [Apophysomyces sp. BC1021]KAG0191161.1 Signal peptidase complex catalytic subunit S11C [Apophysomyces sp. BC1034]